MTESFLFKLEDGKTPMETMQESLDIRGIEANAEELTIGQYRDLIEANLQ